MSEPTTFYPVAIGDEVGMKASPDGGYVLYEHYAALRTTITQQAQEIERLKLERNGWKDIILAERKGRLEAESNLAAMTRERDEAIAEKIKAQSQCAKLESVLFGSDVVKLREQLAASQARVGELEEQVHHSREDF